MAKKGQVEYEDHNNNKINRYSQSGGKNAPKIIWQQLDPRSFFSALFIC